MKILLYIIIAFLAPWILFVIGVFLHTVYELATSKVSKEEQERRIATYEREKQKKKTKKKGSSFHYLSYPSPLNRWGLWN